MKLKNSTFCPLVFQIRARAFLGVFCCPPLLLSQPRGPCMADRAMCPCSRVIATFHRDCCQFSYQKVRYYVYHDALAGGESRYDPVTSSLFSHSFTPVSRPRSNVLHH